MKASREPEQRGIGAAAAAPLRVIALGAFGEPLPPLAGRLRRLGVQPLRAPTLARLPAPAQAGDLLLTDLDWLLGLSADEAALLGRFAGACAAWLALAKGAARFKDQVAWQRRGVTHFFDRPCDAEQLAVVVEDIHDRLCGPPLKVVLVDDDAASLAVHGEMLRRAGCEVLPASDPLSALDLLERSRPDVLVADIEMPACRGPELVTLARQRAAHARLPAIFLTAMEGLQDKLLARRAAAEDFLPKPVAAELLVAAVDAQGRRYRAWQRETARAAAAQANERLRSRQLRDALDEHAIVSIADAEGNIVEVNDRFCEISGYRREELVGQNHRIVKSGLHPPEFYRELWRTIGSGKTWHGEICNRRKDGRLYWVAASIMPICVPVGEGDGQVRQYISVRTDITRIKEQQEATRVRDERLRRSQVYANIGTWDWNIRTGELYWSERIAPLFGYAEGELETSYENFLRAVHPDDRQAVIDAVNACIERDVPYEIEHRVIWPDGQVRWLLERGAVTRDAEGRALNMLGVVQDIDARKRAELALAESEARFRGAFETSSIGIGLVSLEGRWLKVNPALCRIAGYSEAELLATDFQSITHPDDLDADLELVGRLVRGEIPNYQLEKRYITRDGRPVWILLSVALVRDAEGRPLYFVSQVNDIDARKRAELALAESERLLREAQSLARIGNWTADLATGALTWSDEIYRIFGYEPGAIAPSVEAFHAMVHPEDLARVRESEKRAEQTGRHDVIHRIVLPDGSVRHVHELARMDFDAAGRPVRLSGTVQDVTERMLFEQQLIAAREEAEAANRAKSDFLSSMSHELRTPLNAVIGFAQLLEGDEALSAEQQDSVREIVKAGRHLLDLINEVLDLSRIEAGRIDLSMEGLALAPLIDDCVHCVAPLAARRAIVVSADVPASCHAFADRNRLRQALLNLLSNAIKYNVHGGRVTVSVRPGAADMLRIEVRDTGPGIAPERLAQLFKPFNRLGKEASDIEGTGIGLTIVRRLAELMGGTVGVESTVGEGSAFWIELAAAPAEEAGAGEAAGGTVPADPVGAEGATVLAIDDNPTNLKLIAQMVGRICRHLRLSTAHSAELGLALAQAQRPDLILLDIGMPGMNGLELLAILKAHEALKRVPVIAVTAHAMPHDIERGLAAGFAEYLTKPLDLDALRASLLRHLPPRRQSV